MEPTSNVPAPTEPDERQLAIQRREAILQNKEQLLAGALRLNKHDRAEALRTDYRNSDIDIAVLSMPEWPRCDAAYLLPEKNGSGAVVCRLPNGHARKAHLATYQDGDALMAVRWSGESAEITPLEACAECADPAFDAAAAGAAGSALAPLLKPQAPLPDQDMADLADRAAQLTDAVLVGLKTAYEDLAMAVTENGPASPHYVIARQVFKALGGPILEATARLGIEVPEATMPVEDLARRGRARRSAENKEARARGETPPPAPPRKPSRSSGGV
jgi:hypothetical protein